MKQFIHYVWSPVGAVAIAFALGYFTAHVVSDVEMRTPRKRYDNPQRRPGKRRWS